MPDTTTDTPTEAHDADSLAGAVNALIDEIEGVCEAFDRSRSDDPPAPARATPASPSAAPTGKVNLLTEDAPADASAQAPKSSADEPDALPAPAPAPDDSIDDIDAELAAAADEELAGEFESMDDLAGARAAFDPSLDESLEEALDAQATEMAAPAAPVRAPAPAPEAEAPEPEPAPAARARRRQDWGGRAARVLSLPLSRLSRVQRDTIGWVALNTLFLAACVWLFVLLR